MLKPLVMHKNCPGGLRRVAAFGFDALGDGSGCFVVEFFGDALVGVAGEGGGGVAELFGDNFDVDAGFEGDGGGAVP